MPNRFITRQAFSGIAAAYVIMENCGLAVVDGGERATADAAREQRHEEHRPAAVPRVRHRLRENASASGSRGACARVGGGEGGAPAGTWPDWASPTATGARTGLRPYQMKQMTMSATWATEKLAEDAAAASSASSDAPGGQRRTAAGGAEGAPETGNAGVVGRGHPACSRCPGQRPPPAA